MSPAHLFHKNKLLHAVPLLLVLSLCIFSNMTQVKGACDRVDNDCNSADHRCTGSKPYCRNMLPLVRSGPLQHYCCELVDESPLMSSE